MIKIFFILLGSISLAIGLIGIVIPGLPTTPFVLLSAVLYLKGSPSIYYKIIQNSFLETYLKRSSNNLKEKALISAILIMWIMILISAFYVFQEWKWRIMLFVLGLIGTIVKIRLIHRNKFFKKK